jgi:HEAT repeat protein
MNWKSVALGFVITLIVGALALLAVSHGWKAPANADGSNHAKGPQDYRYKTPIETTREGLRKEIFDGLERSVVIPRYYTVLAIGETRDPYFTPTLAKLLESEDDDSVKAAAIEALAKIGGPEASDLLSRTLAQSVGHVKSEAAAAIGYLKNEAALRGLRQALAAKNTQVRVRAVVGITHYGDKPAVRELITMALEDAQFKVREKMVEQIPDLPAGLVRFTVMRAMKDDRAEIRKTALEKLAQTDVALPEAELVSYLQDKSAAVKTAAAELCGKRKLKSAVPALVALAEPDASEKLLAAVATALGQIADPQAVDALVKVAGVEPFIPRGDALLALGRVKHEASRARLKEELNHKMAYVRHRAALALHLMGEPGMVDFFDKSLDSDELVTRANCVYTLCEEARPEFIPIYKRAVLNDPESRVRQEAIKGLAKLLDNPEAVACYKKAVQDKDRDVRYWLAQSIARNPRPALIEVMRAATQDDDRDVRREAYRYLLDHDRQASADLLRMGGKDLDWRVKTLLWAKLYPRS